MRGLTGWGVGGLMALLLVVPASARPSHVACPLRPGGPSGGDVQWAFSDSGRPIGHAVNASYVHGRGSWTGGHASGTACTTDSLAGGSGVRDLVLAVRGKSKLTGRVTQGGLLGVRLLLPVTVHVSDDKACATGATGTISLFASYYSVHRDTMQIKFASHCTGHNRSYGGPALHVYIARHDAQVNAP